MEPWDEEIFQEEVVVDFLDELSDLEEDDIVQAVDDALVTTVKDPHVTADDLLVGQAAATITAIWSGAPYSAGDVVEEYPFIRSLTDQATDAMQQLAFTILEQVDTDSDLDSFLEALTGAEVLSDSTGDDA
ncbi:DUF4259 domain-containing protein [Corynebacterium choanae]|uniref:DUF4259 domain-containing protein n=1 Tax=Corynebacterium choanae TaxID=1862358 RepID=A0A3G6J4V3_9CORY|nr:DUF4259 domain-containing protein [Corynebacterium choanae]AZA12912.1 hypothetical protein CCHOA_02475 [Corynebacterium choanae]